MQEKGEQTPQEVVDVTKERSIEKKSFRTQWTHLRNQAARLKPRRSANKHAARGKVTPG